MTVADEVLPIVSPANAGKASGFTWAAGSFTVGLKFRTHVPYNCVGIRFWAKYAGVARTIRCKLWTSVGTALLATVDVSVDGSGAGQVVEALFAAAVALPGNTASTESYYVTVWDTTAASYPTNTISDLYLPVALGPFPTHEGAYVIAASFAAGDAYPGTDLGTFVNYSAEPILKL